LPLLDALHDCSLLSLLGIALQHRLRCCRVLASHSASPVDVVAWIVQTRSPHLRLYVT
jgi:hypothetical protein